MNMFRQTGNKLSTKQLPSLFTILALGFLLRLAWALTIDVVPVSDSAAYLVLAQSVAAGKGYAWADGTLTAFWPPGTSVIYGALFAVFGAGYWPVITLHLFAGTAVVYLGFRLASAIFNPTVAIVAACFLALWPLLIQFTTILASEILFLVPVLLAILLVVESDAPKLRHYLLFGALLALATYIRPTAIPLIVIIPVLQAVRHASLRHLAGWIGVGGLVCALAMLPWSARNTTLFGQSTGLSTNFGANLWMGNNPNSQGAYQPLGKYSSIANEKQRDDQMRSDAIAFIKEQPEEFLKLGVRRVVKTFDRETIGVAWNIRGVEDRFGKHSSAAAVLKLVSTVYWYAMLAAAVVGLVFLVRTEGWKILSNPVFMLSGFFAAIPAIMVGQDRYHIPMIPMIACLAAYAVMRVLRVKSATTVR